MKIVTIIVRVLLGLVFVIFGLNGFLQFIPIARMPAGVALQFLTVLMQSHWGPFVSAFQLIGAALLLIGLYIPLAQAILGPVIVNILLYHLPLDHFGASIAMVVGLLWVFLFWRYRQYFANLFVRKATVASSAARTIG